MKQKGFTLIELLVVIAIIGILAAIGVLSFGGFQTAAKTNAAKSNHKQVVQFITVEVAKCDLGEEKIFPSNNRPYPDGNLYCHHRNAANIEGNSISYFYEKNFKNPYDTKKYAVKSAAAPTTDDDVGYTHLHSFSQIIDLYIWTCFKKPCSDSNNVLSEIIKNLKP